MTTIDSTNDQNTMRRVIQGYMCTLTIKKLKLSYLHCYTKNICKIWRLENTGNTKNHI